MEKPVELRKRGRIPASLQIYECFFPDGECNKKYHDSMYFLKDHLIRSHFKKELDGILSDLQEKVGLGRDSHHCPLSPCGYFGQMRLDVIKHLALTHGYLSGIISKYSDQVGVLEQQQELLKLIARVKPNLDSNLTVVTCDWCNQTFASKYLTNHQALQHFPLQYKRRLTELQAESAGGRRACPSPGCKYSVSVNVQVKQVTSVLTQHMALKHLSVDEIAAQDGASLLSCPFVESSFKPCRTKLSVSSSTDLPLVCNHIINHVSNLIEDYIRDLIRRAKEFFSRHGELCPFGDYNASFYGGDQHLRQHVFDYHREELAVLILSTVTKSDSQLIKDILTHTKSSQAKLFISSFLTETDNKEPHPGPSSTHPRSLSPEKCQEDAESVESDEGDSAFSCGICHQMFSQAKDVLEHTQLIHMKPKVKVADIFFNKSWNRKACSSWQQFFFSQDADYQLNQYYYKADRKCLKHNCDFYTKSPTLMLKHIRKAHVLK